MVNQLPPELWLCVFNHVVHVPVPDIYSHATNVGPSYTKSYIAALRNTLVTTRAIVRVCRRWWHLAMPYLYRSVYVGRAHHLTSLSSTLARYAAGKGTVVGGRPLGEYTQRLDIAMRDHGQNADAELDALAVLIAHMSRLDIVSFAVTSSYAAPDLPDSVLDALQHSAASLRVLDWSSTRLQPSASRIAALLADCTQLRILNCPQLVWSKEFERGGIPPTVTTLRLHGLIHITCNPFLPQFDPNTVRRSEPSALQELILDLNRDIFYWGNLLYAYREQLVSVHLYMPNYFPIDMDGHLRFLASTCPRLRFLTITSDRFTSFIRPHLVFPSIVYLGLGATRSQSQKRDLKLLFGLLEELRSSVPSLQVVRLLNERNVQRLLVAHIKYMMHALQPFVETMPFRIEDANGVLLTDRLKMLGCK